MDDDVRSSRVASVVAATAVALASGTNYAFSAWGPEFGRHLQLSATGTNIIGVAGNMGMYATGIPTGLLVDKKGPRWGIAIGTVALAIGYFPLHSAYELGPKGYSLPLLSFCSFLTGFGSCSGFSAAIKTATINWPDNRGTATAFPLAGFGLSAFFFTSLANLAFGDNISDFLLMLSVGTLCLNVGALPFMTLISRDGTEYSSVPVDDESVAGFEPPKSPTTKGKHKRTPSRGRSSQDEDDPMSASDVGPSRSDSRSQSRKSSIDEIDRPPPALCTTSTQSNESSLEIEISGTEILRRVEFWQLFVLLALLSGVGLMTINNIGNDVKALLRRWDARTTAKKIQRKEHLQVSILSLGSFAGRLLSGIGSDYLTKQQASRFWCLVASAGTFVAAQISALSIINPHLLTILSTLTGLAYGALFGVFPALVADTFGTRGLSFNWGLVILAPVISGNIFNLYYGYVYDDHTHTINDGSMDCPDGIDCYMLAYRWTLIASLIGVGLALWCVFHQQKRLLHRRAHSMGLPGAPRSP